MTWLAERFHDLQVGLAEIGRLACEQPREVAAWVLFVLSFTLSLHGGGYGVVFWLMFWLLLIATGGEQP